MNGLALYLIAPAILLIVTLILVRHAFKKLDNCLPTEGTIVRFQKTSSMMPVVSYNVDGVDYVFVGNYSSSRMRIGQSIKILYSIDDHSKATIKAGLYLAPIITGGIALLFLLPVIVMLVLARGDFSL
ncbi:MAG TPA: hypothetical protein GXZ86_04875 [Clostridiales bacterium]|jgi:hypothetical protein|nr:hypothetical protein [Clostridiales bacterium]